MEKSGCASNQTVHKSSLIWWAYTLCRVKYILTILVITVMGAYPQGLNDSANVRFLQRLSIIFGFRRDCPWSLASCRDYRPRKMASCRDCPRDSASCRDSRPEAKSHGQSLQEAIYQAEQSRQEARDRRQSRWEPTMTDSHCRKSKFADSSLPCATITHYKMDR